MRSSLERGATLGCAGLCVVAACSSGGSGVAVDGGGALGADGAFTTDGSAPTDGAAPADGALSSDGGTVPPDASGEAGDAAGQGGDAACAPEELPSPTCNAIVSGGSVVTSTSSSGSPPEAQGGAIPDGTYVLVSSTYYGGYSAPADFQ